MAGCIFCEKPDDASGMDVYSTCKIGNGKPCPPCVEYISLEAEIQVLQELLQKKLVTRREIREKINQRHNRMFIVMPRELIAYIFELAAWVDPLSLPFTPIDEDKIYSPLLLGTVCRTWRSVAWSMPQLWTYINIDVPDIDALPARIDIAKQWLSRTGNHLPLSIHLATYDNYNPEDVFTDEDHDDFEDGIINNFGPLAELLGLHSSRWQVLSVTGPPEMIDLLCNKYHGAPMLQSLLLDSTRPPRYPSHHNVLFDHRSEEYPQPSFVFLSQITPFLVGLEWHRITELILQSMFFEDVIYILPNVPNLGELELHNITGFQDALTFNTTMITCQKMDRLYLRNCGPDSSAFLASLTLPALKKMAIDLHGQNSVLMHVALLLQRSASTLTALALVEVPEERALILELIESLQYVKDLEICEPRRHESESPFLQVLQEAYTISNSPVLPKLRRIYYVLHPEGILLARFIIGQIVHPMWTTLFPEWRGFAIRHEPCPTFFSNPVNRKYIIEQLETQTLHQLSALVHSGKEFIIPFEITASDILETLKNRTT